MKYRIKIEENKNGEKTFIPQVGITKLLVTNWYNIVFKRLLKSDFHYYHSTEFEFTFPNETQAMNVIDSHKQYVNKEKEEVKTSYKMID